MGIVPIWGFQLAVAIAGAFLFRLNKPLVILAAHISIPPMIPIILFASHLTGSIWMGINAETISFSKSLTLEGVKENFIQYVAGAVTLATVAGLTFGALTYLLIKVFRYHKNLIR